MSKLQEEFDNLLAEQEELRKKFQTKAQELFKETTKKFFAKNPAVTAIVWSQYTPYFNDGDTCVFSVGDPNFTNVDDLEELSSWGEYEGEDETKWSENSWGFTYNMDKHKTVYEGVDLAYIDKFSRLIQSGAMEEVMEAMFGDHVRVVATRDGFEVNDYDHE